MEARKQVLFLTSRFPYPLEKGDKLRAYYQLKQLSETCDVTLICTSEKKVSDSEMAEINRFCKDVHVLYLGKWGLFLQVLRGIIFSKPFQVCFFYRYSHHRRIKKIIDSLKPDLIYCQLVRMSEYVKNEHHYRKALDYMDVLSKGMERRAETEPWYKSWFFALESKRLKLYEQQIFSYFDFKTIISKQDRDFIFHPQKDEIHIVPNGISVDFFEKLDVSKKYDIVFTGNFSYAPNIEAAKFLVHEILPILHKQGTSVRVLLSGASPSKSVQSLAGSNVTVSGWVDDIRESYQMARLFVAPLFIGTGLQNKLLEAMASELPCITTPLVNNALGATPDKELLIASDATEFAAKINTLLLDETKSIELAKNAKSFIAENFSWEKQNEKILSIWKFT